MHELLYCRALIAAGRPAAGQCRLFRRLAQERSTSLAAAAWSVAEGAAKCSPKEHRHYTIFFAQPLFAAGRRRAGACQLGHSSLVAPAYRDAMPALSPPAGRLSADDVGLWPGLFRRCVSFVMPDDMARALAPVSTSSGDGELYCHFGACAAMSASFTPRAGR